MVEETAVSCEDLALDIWVTPQGHTTILDEDEFAALDISLAEKSTAQSALEFLVITGQQQDLPK